MKLSTKILLSIIVISLCTLMGFGIYACDQSMPVHRTDYKAAEDLFLKRLETLPAGPVETKYNDWDEIIYECRQTSLILANKCVKNCGE